MKAILEFNLPEEQDEYTKTTKANRMALVIWDMLMWLRPVINRHEGIMKLPEYKGMSYRAAEAMNKKLCDLMEFHDVMEEDIT